jgi:hypothetical protein
MSFSLRPRMLIPMLGIGLLVQAASAQEDRGSLSKFVDLVSKYVSGEVNDAEPAASTANDGGWAAGLYTTLGNTGAPPQAVPVESGPQL